MDLEAAYERARTEGVLVPRPDRGLVRVSGEQRAWFLHNTVTADIETLEVGRWAESFFLTPKGKIVAHFRVGAGDDALYLDVDPPATEQLVDWFVRYRFRTAAEVERLSEPCTTVLGPPAAAVAADGAFSPVTFGGRLGDVATADVFGATAPDLPVAPPELYDIVRVEAGVGAFGDDYTTDHLPQEAGLTRIVPIDRGCYVGQETVARIHFRGHVNKVVRPLRLDEVDPADALGSSVELDGASIGIVTSAVRSPGLGPIALGMIRTEPEPDTPVTIAGGRATLGAVPEGTKVNR